MIKRICSVILTICMSMSAIGALAYEDVKTAKEDIAVSLVTGMGIMSSVSDNEFGSSNHVRRGEFALSVAKMLNQNIQPTSGTGYYSDVDLSTEEGAAVEFLVSIGVIPKSGAEYNPNDEETYVNAVRILLNALGYSKLAEYNGGYPGGYLKVATDNSLNSGLSLMTNSVLTKSNAAILIYNAMFMYPMEYDNGDYKRIDKTFIENNLDLYEVKGVVTGAGKEYIGAGKQLADNNVEINGEIFNAGNSNIADYIGYNVRAYYRGEAGNENVIVAFTENANTNTVTVVNTRDLEVSGNSVTYYEGAKSRTLKVSPSAAVMYNGKYYSEYTKLEDVLNIPEGEVKFISNDSSGTANVIIVNEYKDMLVERVDRNSGRLYLKNGSSTETDVPYLSPIVTIAADEMEYEIYLDGKQIEFNDLMPNDAISMARSLDGEITKLYVSRETVTGKIESVSWGNEIKINGTTYPISRYFKSQYSVGLEGTFAITSDGNFLGLVDAATNNTNNYAYVLNSYIDEGPEQAFIKLFTGNGEVKTYQCASNVSVNGSKTSYDKIPTLVSKSQIVTFRTNSDDMITSVNRPYDASTNLNYVNETEFVKNWNKSSVRYIDGVMGMSFITDSTVIFSMPRFDRNNIADYKILSMADLDNRTYADVTCYDVDGQGRAGALLIVEDISDSVSMGNSLFFVNKKVEAVNEDGDIVCRIEGFEDGQPVTLDFGEDSTSVTYEDGWMNYVGNEDFDTGYENLNPGDAIQYSIGNNGEVSAYRVVYNNFKAIYTSDGELTYNDANNFYEDWSQTGSVTKQDFYDDLYIAYGDVQMRYMDYMVVLGLNQRDRSMYESSSSPIQIIDYYRPMNLLNASIYVYDVKQKEVSIGDTEDVLKSDVVFVRSKNMGEKNEVMVYQNN